MMDLCARKKFKLCYQELLYVRKHDSRKLFALVVPLMLCGYCQRKHTIFINMLTFW